MEFGEPATIVERLRFVYCPMCRAELGDAVDADGATRSLCSACGWIHYLGNVVGVNVVATTDDGRVAAIYPQDEAGLAALPGGVIEYGESPERAAVREVQEETGLDVRVERSLGHYLWRDHPYGPMLSFVFGAAVIGGQLRDSSEGRAALVLPDSLEISPSRRGSATAWALYRSATTP